MRYAFIDFVILCTAYCHGHSRELSEQQKRTSMRDIAVLELLFATGIRVSELCALKHRDVNIIEGEVKIYGKVAKERLVQTIELCPSNR